MKKRILLYLLGAAVAMLAFSSCQPDSDEFDASYLVGYWKSGTEYWRYDINNRGAMWNTADDVNEDEGIKFKWRLEKSELTHIYIYDNGNDGPPKVYTVTALTPTTLKYEDYTGKKFSFTKTVKP